MPKRTGESSLLKFSALLCRFLAKYTTIITLLYPTNTALIAALAAADAACQTLNTELAAVQVPGD